MQNRLRVNTFRDPVNAVTLFFILTPTLASIVLADSSRQWRLKYEGLRAAVDNRHPSVVARINK